MTYYDNCVYGVAIVM